jgi:hypothetical protein
MIELSWHTIEIWMTLRILSLMMEYDSDSDWFIRLIRGRTIIKKVSAEAQRGTVYHKNNINCVLNALLAVVGEEKRKSI